MLVFSVVNYSNGVGAIEDLLRRDLERETRAAANSIETSLRDREAALIALSRSRVLRDYVRVPSNQPSTRGNGTQPPQPHSLPVSSSDPAAPTNDAIIVEVAAEVDAFLGDKRNGYVALACVDTNRKPLFRAETARSEAGGEIVRYQATNILPSSVTPDERVWTAAEQTPLRSTLSQPPSGTIIRYTVPIFTGDVTAQAPRGALIVDLKLNSLCKDALGSFVDLQPAQPAPRLFVVLDREGRVVYHPNETLLYRAVAEAMPPSFKDAADTMLAGESGQKFFTSPEGNRWLASYQPIKTADIFLSVAGNHTAVLHNFRQSALLNIALSALAGLLTAVLLALIVRRMERSIERVTAGAVAIAAGRLDQRIEVRSSDETRLLAESFNQMSDRLREQIARESESKQFESFMRLAAMLTHDLKNAITALSLVVSNMEQQFDHEEFRAEAMESLKASTDKLRSLVAKLSGPVESLSGEYQRPHPTDLVPYLKRVLNRTAKQAQALHKVEVRLPAALVATVDAERIERVFENLVLNALEAMGAKSGTLTINAGPESETEIFFSVADTGPGMSEEFQRTRLFRAFATTKRRGVGLGLYTCREVVKAHGGRIEVKSEKGAGATFRVVLPSGRFTESE